MESSYLMLLYFNHEKIKRKNDKNKKNKHKNNIIDVDNDYLSVDSKATTEPARHDKKIEWGEIFTIYFE